MSHTLGMKYQGQKNNNNENCRVFMDHSSSSNVTCSVSETSAMAPRGPFSTHNRHGIHAWITRVLLKTFNIECYNQ